MTPTKTSRIQTRIILTLFISLPISVAAGLLMHLVDVVFLLLSVSFIVGLIFDVINSYLQQSTWDEDWSVTLMILSWILEASCTVVLVNFFMPLSSMMIALYIAIGLFLIIFQISLLHVLFPYKRFQAGRIW